MRYIPMRVMMNTEPSIGKKRTHAMKNNTPIAVSLISLGCPKNTVDSERLLALLVRQGFLLAERPEDSDICLVNTCGFIADARNEVAQTLKEVKQERDRGRGPMLCVATGCLVEHARQPGMEFFLRDADLCVPFRDYLRLPEILSSALAEKRSADQSVLRSSRRKNGVVQAVTHRKMDPAFNALPRVITGAGHTVSLKISEGCSNGCSFCAIPGIRGGQVDRSMEAVIQELRELSASGVREISIIAQDTSAYGMQRYGKRRLHELLQGMADAVKDDIWFRLMYVYPGHLDEKVLNVMAGDPRFCPYIDMPLQHVSDRILKAMRRPCSQAETLHLLDRVRELLPEAALRTALIVGYPGETEMEFCELLTFVQQQAFDHLGVFTYSPEPGTLAFKEPDDVPAEEKARRKNLLMDAQQSISARKLRRMKGRVAEVMIDGERLVEDAEGQEIEVYSARLRQQAPEIDGLVILDGVPVGMSFEPGTRGRVKIIGSGEYDLFGRLVDNGFSNR